VYFFSRFHFYIHLLTFCFNIYLLTFYFDIYLLTFCFIFPSYNNIDMPLAVTNLGPSSAALASINLTLPSGTALLSFPSNLTCQNSTTLIACWATSPIRPGVADFVLVLTVSSDLQVDSLNFSVVFNVSDKNLNSSLSDYKIVELLVRNYFPSL
jgi:hypothetical protein